MTKHDYSIAVLLPTHKRTDALSTSLFSLIDRAEDLSTIQFLLGIDNNDDVALDYFAETIQPRLDELGINYSAIGFEPLGYAGLNRYFDTLASYADADWHFVWCDDAIMNTDAWDQRIRECTGEFRLLKVHTHNEHPYSIFPIMPAEWRETMGYLSRHQLVDAEVSQIAYFLDIMKIIEVDVTHDRQDLTGNNADANANASAKQYFEGNPNDPRDFHHVTFVRGRELDMERLAQHLEATGRDMTFFHNVKAGKQNPWQRMRENDPNGQTASFVTVTDADGRQRMVRQ